MEKSLCDALTKAGICADRLLERLMNNECLAGRLLKQFLEDKSYQNLVQAVMHGDTQEALTQAHTLKGVCGNLSMEPLYELLSQQVRLLREENWQAAQALMPAIERDYNAVTDCIRKEFE